MQEIAHLPNPPQCTEVAPGVVGLPDLPASFFEKTPLFFSCQILPNAVPADGDSIKTIATSVVERLITTLDSSSEPWTLHVFDPETAEDGKAHSRPRLIQEETLNLLKQKRRSLLKRLTDAPQGCAVQVLLATPRQAFISITLPEDREIWRPNLSPFLAGYVAIPDDKSPPSRAFKKLREALLVFNLAPARGEQCVDLGACPGGWTHVMVERGLKVTAVDRSPLDPNLMKHRNVSFVRGDAFTWLPKVPVTWLICDVITTPDRTREILDQWLSRKACALFCVTIKFKGEPDFRVLQEIRLLLDAKSSWFSGKQLTNNKNELTVVGRV